MCFKLLCISLEEELGLCFILELFFFFVLNDFLIIFIHMYFSIIGTMKMNQLYLSLSTLFFFKAYLFLYFRCTRSALLQVGFL